MFLDQFLCTNQVRNCIQNYCDKCTPKFGVDPFIANSSKQISVQGVVLKMKMNLKEPMEINLAILNCLKN